MVQKHGYATVEEFMSRAGAVTQASHMGYPLANASVYP